MRRLCMAMITSTAERVYGRSGCSASAASPLARTSRSLICTRFSSCGISCASAPSPSPSPLPPSLSGTRSKARRRPCSSGQRRSRKAALMAKRCAWRKNISDLGTRCSGSSGMTASSGAQALTCSDSFCLRFLLSLLLFALSFASARRRAAAAAAANTALAPVGVSALGAESALGFGVGFFLRRIGLSLNISSSSRSPKSSAKPALCESSPSMDTVSRLLSTLSTAWPCRRGNTSLAAFSHSSRSCRITSGASRLLASTSRKRR
mmetsp:Transcript_13865/g.41773  ORF Transcript_13865/g.41773 Transcript_13865/m.41773 type:complete len:264 (-) Transcript_13865:1116-1907(-)